MTHDWTYATSWILIRNQPEHPNNCQHPLAWQEHPRPVLWSLWGFSIWRMEPSDIQHQNDQTTYCWFAVIGGNDDKTAQSQALEDRKKHVEKCLTHVKTAWNYLEKNTIIIDLDRISFIPAMCSQSLTRWSLTPSWPYEPPPKEYTKPPSVNAKVCT